MRFIQEFGYSVKVGQEEAHQKWFAANEKKFAAAHPKGTKYIGTFAVVFSSEKRAGFYKTFVEMDSYAAMDALAAAAKDGKKEFGKLLRDSSRFADYEWNTPWSNGLYKSVVDATIFDPKT
ncbi:MAG: hypothetical protein ACXWWQ_03830 [Candidatus Limnocylindria bacterium]